MPQEYGLVTLNVAKLTDPCIYVTKAWPFATVSACAGYNTTDNIILNIHGLQGNGNR
jgi:hypothetical protein